MCVCVNVVNVFIKQKLIKYYKFNLKKTNGCLIFFLFFLLEDFFIIKQQHATTNIRTLKKKEKNFFVTF